METVKIVHVIEEWDMRARHKLRRMKKARELKSGEAILALNRAQTMFRIIDSEGGVHDYYQTAAMEKNREVWSPSGIRTIVALGLRVKLNVGALTRGEVKLAA